MNFSYYLAEAASFVWGMPLLVFLALANIILIYYSKMIPLKGFRHSIRLIWGKSQVDEPLGAKAEGQITHFQALSNALAATIGLGNIAGVAVAIYQGGPGAVFWMWISAFIGMNTKFFECSLAVMYRGRDYQGEVQGGPMYYIEQGLGPKYKALGIAFAIFGLVGTMSLFQVNQLSHFLEKSYSLDPRWTGICLALITIYILKGGLRRISEFTSKAVPAMSIFYILLCIMVLFTNHEDIVPVFVGIFQNAFGVNQVAGGIGGYALMHIIQTGVKRASFSNEAGIGTAPMAHGNAKTSEPISEGYVAMLGPFIDTIIVCTLTAVTILVGLQDEIYTSELNGINLTTRAFVASIGEFGRHGLGVVILLFAFSTIVGMANYNKKCWDYLFKGRRGLRDRSFVLFYAMSIIVGAVIEMKSVINIIDISYALMAVPNIIAVVFLAGKVRTSLKSYNQKYDI